MFIFLLNSNELSRLVINVKRQREDIRLNNLEILIAEAGSATKLAQRAGTSESYISQVRRKMRTAKGTPRGIGDELSSRLEQGMDKPQGWMDEPHEIYLRPPAAPRVVRVGNLLTLSDNMPLSVRGPLQDQIVVGHGSTDTKASVLPSGEDAPLDNETADTNQRDSLSYALHSTSAPQATQRDTRTDGAHVANVVTLCPLISWAQVGAASSMSSDDQGQRFEGLLPCPVPCSQGAFVLRVKGASMEPKFANGDLVFVDPAVPAESGKFVVVRSETSDEAVFRQLIVEGGRQYLKALSPDWPDRIVELEPGVAICGVVVFKGEMV